MKFTRLFAAMSALACAAVLAACTFSAGTSTYMQGTLDGASGIKVEAQNADTDMEATSGAAIVVEEGDVIVVSPDLTAGSIHLTITPTGGGAAIYDADASGRVLYTIEAAPGTYDVKTYGKGATGAMTVVVQDADELAAQDEALDEALKEQGVN